MHCDPFPDQILDNLAMYLAIHANDMLLPLTGRALYNTAELSLLWSFHSCGFHAYLLTTAELLNTVVPPQLWLPGLMPVVLQAT